jgi:linoleoyl-CoA desaturase
MYETLKFEVMAYIEKQDGAKLQYQIVCKSIGIFVLFLGTYFATLSIYTQSICLGLISNSVFVFACLLMVFCIFHDSSHGSIGKNRVANYLLCTVVGALFGASSNAWILQHVRQHHGHTNIPGSDKDIEQGSIFRLHQETQRRPWHRWQHLYALPLYSLIVLKWALVDDFICVLSNTYNLGFKRRVAILINALLAKAIHILFFFIVPYYFIGSMDKVLIFYLYSLMAIGLVISIIFQLAHLTGVQDFPKRRLGDWSRHHLSTTANFANNSRMFTGFLGALNFQIEHHLFPTLSHQLYPKISPIVKEYCLKNGLVYHEFPSFLAALNAHLSYLKELGLSH